MEIFIPYRNNFLPNLSFLNKKNYPITNDSSIFRPGVYTFPPVFPFLFLPYATSVFLLSFS
jgi:hypothetical protein